MRTKANCGHPVPDFVLAERRWLIEIDEIQHFTTDRLVTFNFYGGTNVGYDVAGYRDLILKWHSRADRYRAAKRTKEFDFDGGRRAQRAYFDAVRDLGAPVHGWTIVRIPAPECDGAIACQRLLELAA